MCDWLLEVKDNNKYLYVTSVCSVNMSHLYLRVTVNVESASVVLCC